MKNSEKSPNTPLVIFFILSFGLAWALSLLAVAQNYGLIGETIPLEPFLILGAWTPNIAAFLVIGLVMRRKGGIKSLVLGWTKWKVNPRWYLVSFSPILLGFLTIWIYRLYYGVSPVPDLNLEQMAMLLPLVLLTGATGEQLGWRGFALPWLQTRMSALASSCLLGLIWSLWHIPLWYAGTGLEGFPFWAYTLIGVSFSVMVTWALNHTRGSLLIATLSHLFLNISVNLIENEAAPLLAFIFTAYAVIITLIYGPRRLTRVLDLPINAETKSWLD